MVTIIKKGISKEELKKLFDKISSETNVNKGFDAYKYCGAVNFGADGLNIQYRLRDEWK